MSYTPGFIDGPLADTGWLSPNVTDTFQEMEARCPDQYLYTQPPRPPAPEEPVIRLEPLTITEKTKRFPADVRAAIVFCRANSGKYSRAVVHFVRRVVGA